MMFSNMILYTVNKHFMRKGKIQSVRSFDRSSALETIYKRVHINVQHQSNDLVFPRAINVIYALRGQ